MGRILNREESRQRNRLLVSIKLREKFLAKLAKRLDELGRPADAKRVRAVKAVDWQKVLAVFMEFLKIALPILLSLI